MGKQHLIGAEGTSRMGGQRDGDQATRQTAALLARDPAAHAPLDNPDAVSYLLERLREAGAHEQAAALADRAARAAEDAPLGDPGGVARLLEWLREAGAHEQAAALLARDPNRPRHPRQPGRRGQPAEQPAEGRRGRSSRRAGRAAAGGRHVLSLPRPRRSSQSIPVWPRD